MNKLYVLLMACSLSFSAYADKPKPNTRFYTKCIGGHLYAVAETYKGGISIQQVKANKMNWAKETSKPVKCK